MYCRSEINCAKTTVYDVYVRHSFTLCHLAFSDPYEQDKNCQQQRQKIGMYCFLLSHTMPNSDMHVCRSKLLKSQKFLKHILSSNCTGLSLMNKLIKSADNMQSCRQNLYVSNSWTRCKIFDLRMASLWTAYSKYRSSHEVNKTN